ncbi:MAG TPA: SBBP repeat-containing protein [Dissulfurispiraceae bacterium]|nr:SBBP repeat-containing protein [Dissulfurispiraceae bacterium]
MKHVFIWISNVMCMTIAVLCALSVLLLGYALSDSGPSATESDKTGPNSNLLQFRAGNHVLGFAPTKAYLAALDHALTAEFLGTKGVMPVSEGDLQSSGVSSGAQALRKVIYKNLWPGINLVYSATKDGITESTYLISPGADMSKIRLQYNVPVELRKNGEIRFKFAKGYVTEAAPVAWQEIDGKKVAIKIEYQLSGGAVGFKVGDYNRTRQLVIDPVYSWHTFYGSTGDSDENVAFAITTDTSGNVYVAGRSEGTWNGEGDVPPIDAYRGYKDIFVLKLNSKGEHQWHTFHGSQYDDDSANDIAVDQNGNVYVTGWSKYGWTGPSGHAPGNPFNGNTDLFVLKLDKNGGYMWHTFYGSASYADQGMGIAVDSTGNIYVAGGSKASWTGPDGQDPKHPFSGSADILVLKLDNGGGYLWHAFYGSSANETAYGVALDSNANVYVTGYGQATWNGGSNKPPKHAFSSLNNSDDIFVLKLDKDSNYQWHTFYGSGDEDFADRIAADSSGSTYITGGSWAAWKGSDGQDPYHAYGGGMFVLKLDSSGDYKWHTFYGGNQYDEARGIALDANGNIYLAGTSWSWNGPDGQLPLHNQGQITVLKLDSNGGYKWHAFYGSDTSNYAMCIAVDRYGFLYTAGDSFAETWNGDGDTLPLHAFNGTENIFVLKLSAINTCPDHAVTINGGGTPYSYIQTAYGYAANNDILYIQALPFTEDLSLTGNFAVTLKGGYECDFTSNPGFSTVYGKMTISTGTVTVENMIFSN